MQLKIVHTTGFEYDGKANTSFNEARLTPLPDPRADWPAGVSGGAR